MAEKMYRCSCGFESDEAPLKWAHPGDDKRWREEPWFEHVITTKIFSKYEALENVPDAPSGISLTYPDLRKGIDQTLRAMNQPVLPSSSPPIRAPDFVVDGAPYYFATNGRDKFSLVNASATTPTNEMIRLAAVHPAVDPITDPDDDFYRSPSER